MKETQSHKKSQPSKKLVLIFSLLSFTNVIINLDHGIIPAATTYIEATLDIGSQSLGVLGSLVYAGIVVVGLFGGKILLKYNVKKIIIGSYIGMILSLLAFTIDYKNVWPQFLSRFITGMAQAPMLIYFPVWTDNFGNARKTIWLTILQGGVPFGIFTGYVLSSIIANLWQWEYTFYIQVGMIVPCFVLFCFIDVEDFDIKRKAIQNHKLSSDGKINLHNDEDHNKHKETYWQLIRQLVSQKVWLCVTLGISVLYFIVTGIQFWISNYMEEVLGQPEAKVNSVFAIVSITGPVLGCIAGGISTQKAGGYESDKTLYVCLGFCAFACIVAAPIPFLNNFWAVSALIWVLLFCGGALVPPLTGSYYKNMLRIGIMLTSVQPRLRPFANSNTTTIYNLFGFFPAPMVYGYMDQLGPRAGMIFLMFYPNLGLLMMGLAIYYRKKEKLTKPPLEKELKTDFHIDSSILSLGNLASLDQISNTKNGKKQIKGRSFDKWHITERVLEYNQIPFSVSIAQSINRADLQRVIDDVEDSDLSSENQDEDDEKTF